jgi:hypothetical protein
MKSFLLVGCLFLLACSGAPAGNAAASGGDIVYNYTFTNTAHGKKMIGHMVLSLTSDGKIRVDMSWPGIAGQSGKPVKMVLIGSGDKPDQSISIDDDQKTYTINHIELDSLSSPYSKMTSEVTKIGEEPVDGFASVHARVTSDKSMGNFYQSKDTIDIWKSNAVPVQALFMKWVDRFESKSGSMMYTPEVAKKLRDMGCTGFMVRLSMKGKDSNMLEELTSVEHKDLAKSLFEVPTGYKQTKD